MLLVTTYVAASPIHGVGLFAGEDLHPGVPLWELSLHTGLDRIMPPPSQCCPELAEFLRAACYVDRITGEWILQGDNARFINHVDGYRHSEWDGKFPMLGPNTQPHGNGAYRIRVATRAIAKGEEITADYSKHDALYGGFPEVKSDPPSMLIQQPGNPGGPMLRRRPTAHVELV